MSEPAEEYPPAHHLLRDLALDVEHRGDGTSAAWFEVVPECLDDRGQVRAGVLATLVDMIGGGLSAQVAAPNWIATADLTLHLVGSVSVGTIAATARVLRAGRTTVVLEVALQGEHAPVGVATMTFSVLPRRDDNPVISFSGDAPRTTLVLPGSGFAAPICDAVGLTVVDAAAGVVDVPVTPYSRNSLGALQGGVVAIAIDVAAEHALRAACGTPVRVTDMHITYLALVRDRLRTSTEVLHATPAFGSATVDVRERTGGSLAERRSREWSDPSRNDAGDESRRTTVARVVATRADG
jgi:uncharacterized protein (TIGR00369 family)